jgi:hypothetical protein
VVARIWNWKHGLFAVVLALGATSLSMPAARGNSQLAGPPMSPVYNQFYPTSPWSQWGGSGGQTGQMNYPYNPYMDMWPVYVSNYLNWNGSQSLGLGSMTPPIGLPFLQNQLLYNSIAERAI